MIRSRLSWLTGLLACTALIAGCGSSSSTTSSSSSTASTPTTTTSTATTSTAATTPTSTSPASIEAAIKLCKQEIEAQTSLPAGAKTKLESACAKAARGDKSAVKQAAREVCEEVIKTSAIPAGPAREQALTACKGKKG